MEANRIPKRVLYMNLEPTRPRGIPRNNRYQDEVREDGGIAGGEEWQEKVYNREEWKKLLRTARNRCIPHVPKELINELINHLLKVLLTGSDVGKPHWGHLNRLELIRENMSSPIKSVKTKRMKFSNTSTSQIFFTDN
jgi:hypothetical protein